MPSLVICPGCSRHIRTDSDQCPHCDGVPPARGRLAATATALLMGLAVTGCEKGGPGSNPPDDVQPAYGVPDQDPGDGGDTAEPPAEEEEAGGW